MLKQPRPSFRAAYITQAALKHGATKEEIAEALSVAITLNAGATLTYSARVFDTVAAFEKQ